MKEISRNLCALESNGMADLHIIRVWQGPQTVPNEEEVLCGLVKRCAAEWCKVYLSNRHA